MILEAHIHKSILEYQYQEYEETGSIEQYQNMMELIVLDEYVGTDCSALNGTGLCKHWGG